MAVSLTRQQRARNDWARALMAADPLLVPLKLPIAVVAALVVNPNGAQVLRDHQAAILAALTRANEAQGGTA